MCVYFRTFDLKKFGSPRVGGMQEVLYNGQIIDSLALVTSPSKRVAGRRHQSIEPLRCGAQRRGDALPNSQQQGPRSDTSLHLSLQNAAPLNFYLREQFAFEDVQPRCFILRSVLPTRTRFLIDLTQLFFPFPYWPRPSPICSWWEYVREAIGAVHGLSLVRQGKAAWIKHELMWNLSEPKGGTTTGHSASSSGKIAVMDFGELFQFSQEGRE